MNVQCIFLLPVCRFSKEDIPRLASALELPDVYVCKQGTVATGIEALMVLLWSLTYPNRLCDLIALFGCSESELSLIFSKVVILWTTHF